MRTAPLAIKLDDRNAELVRQNLERRLLELAAEIDEINATGGRYLGRQILTGAGMLMLNKLTRRVRVRMQACGGGGGGAAGGTGVAAGGGGGSGVYLEFELVAQGDQPISSGAYSAPVSGGAGGNSAGGNGTTGADCTLNIGGSLYTAKGGGGGVGMASVSAQAFASGGLPASTSSSGTGILSTYDPGTDGIVNNTGFWYSGGGGTAPLGHGTLSGNAGAGSSAGSAGGIGGGGSGAMEQAGGGGKVGGQGGGAVIVVEEWT